MVFEGPLQLNLRKVGPELRFQSHAGRGSLGIPRVSFPTPRASSSSKDVLRGILSSGDVSSQIRRIGLAVCVITDSDDGLCGR